MSRVIDPEEFRERLAETVKGCRAKSVIGPGRSGAIASVYASHMLGVPFIPYGQPCPARLNPLLIVDTAIKTGRTLRKAAARYHPRCIAVAAFDEPSRVRFWYETFKEKP